MPLATYGTQFRTIPNETETFVSTSPTGGVSYVDVKVDGRVITGPIVTLTSIVPYSLGTYLYTYTFSGKYCTDIAVNNSFVGYNSITKQTYTYSSTTAGDTTFASFDNDAGVLFDKVISYMPDPAREKTAIYTFVVNGSPTTKTQKIHLIPTRWYIRLQDLCNRLHSGRSMADNGGAVVEPVGYYTSSPSGWTTPTDC